MSALRVRFNLLSTPSGQEPHATHRPAHAIASAAPHRGPRVPDQQDEPAEPVKMLIARLNDVTVAAR